MAEPGAIGRHYADAPAEELLAAGSYQDAAERAREARYAVAETLLAAGDLRGAALSFGNVPVTGMPESAVSLPGTGPLCEIRFPAGTNTLLG